MTTVARLAAALVALLCADLCHAQSSPAGADTYPNRPVRVLLPFPPGGVVDVMGRLLAQKLSDRLGQNFYVENHGGGGGNIGAAMVQAAPPDGYTLLITSSSFLINPGLQKVPYDPVGGFAPITIPSASPSVLVVNPADPAKTVKELIEAIKKEPGKHSYASAGVGSTPHLQGEMFRLAFGLDMVHVPFGGGGPALQSAVAGHTPIAFAALPPAIPLIKSGHLRALAVIGPKGVSALPGNRDGASGPGAGGNIEGDREPAPSRARQHHCNAGRAAEIRRAWFRPSGDDARGFRGTDQGRARPVGEGHSRREDPTLVRRHPTMSGGGRPACGGIRSCGCHRPNAGAPAAAAGGRSGRPARSAARSAGYAGEWLSIA